MFGRLLIVFVVLGLGFALLPGCSSPGCRPSSSARGHTLEFEGGSDATRQIEFVLINGSRNALRDFVRVDDRMEVGRPLALDARQRERLWEVRGVGVSAVPESRDGLVATTVRFDGSGGGRPEATHTLGRVGDRAWLVVVASNLPAHLQRSAGKVEELVSVVPLGRGCWDKRVIRFRFDDDGAPGPGLLLDSTMEELAEDL